MLVLVCNGEFVFVFKEKDISNYFEWNDFFHNCAREAALRWRFGKSVAHISYYNHVIKDASGHITGSDMVVKLNRTILQINKNANRNSLSFLYFAIQNSG